MDRTTSVRAWAAEVAASAPKARAAARSGLAEIRRFMEAPSLRVNAWCAGASEPNLNGTQNREPVVRRAKAVVLRPLVLSAQFAAGYVWSSFFAWPTPAMKRASASWRGQFK